MVYIGSHSGHFVAVELRGGRLLWTARFEEETPPTGEDGDADDAKRRGRRRVEATAACSSDAPSGRPEAQCRCQSYYYPWSRR